MNFRNRLYRLQYRSVKTQHTSDFNEQTLQREFAKQVQAIDTSLEIMYMAFRNNISMQQVYLDLVKAQGKNIKIRGKDCQKVYQLLSDNKTAEIMFGQIYQSEEKQRKEREQLGFQRQFKKTNQLMQTTLGKTFRNISTEESEPSKKTMQTILSVEGGQSLQQNDLLRRQEKKQNFLMNYMNSAYRRLYSRLVEEIIKKITYYIINKTKLYEMLIYTIAEISRRLETILRRIKNLKDTKMILDVVKMIFEENLLIEKRIYQALVSEGHVVSIQEFFRINGEMLQETTPILQRTISTKSPDNEQQEIGGMKKSIKFFQHHKGLAEENSLIANKKIGYIKHLPEEEDYELEIQQKEVQERSQKLEKNVLHIERMHKEVQLKYNYALDKISDLMNSNEEKIEHDESIFIQESQQKEKEFQFKSDGYENDEYQQKDKDKQKQKGNMIGGILQQLQQGPLGRWKRENNRRKTTKKKTSGFQYFSSQFKKVINQLDEKKGKIKLGSSKSSSVIENKTEKKIEQTFQVVSKINNETVSLKNPLNVARLLGKRFKTIGSSPFLYINKDKHIRNMSRQRTQINNLLKIYENNKKGNEISNILQKKEKDLIKANLLKKLSLKKSKTSNENNNEGLDNDNRGYTINVMKQANDKQDMLMETLKNCNSEFNEIDLKFVNESLMKKISQGTEKAKSCVINLTGSNLRLGKQNENQTQRIFKTQILTNSPNISLFDTPNKSSRKPVSIEPLKTSNLQRVYNEFTNPLNVKYGFYNDHNYRYLMKSLQKCELNKLKLKKGILKRENLLVVHENFMFGESNLQSSRLIKTTSPQVFNKHNIMKPQRSTHPNLKTIQNELQTPQNNFYLTSSSQFSQQRITPLHSKDMDKYILKCIQKNSINFKEKKGCQKLPLVRQNNSQIVKIDSLKITPRNSIGKKKQVYSTQRRIKMK